MASYLAVDPGLRGCGCAVFSGADTAFRLERAGYVVGPETAGRGPEVWRQMGRVVKKWWLGGYGVFDPSVPPWTLVAEVPEVYPGMPKTDPNDLIDLAGVVGAIAGALDLPTHFYLPRQWKGQLPKGVGVLRALAHLSDEERKRVEPAPMKSLDHNVADAVGIGLFHAGRFRRMRVFR